MLDQRIKAYDQLIVNYLHCITERDQCQEGSPEYQFFNGLAQDSLDFIIEHHDPSLARFNWAVNSKSFRKAHGFSGGALD